MALVFFTHALLCLVHCHNKGTMVIDNVLLVDKTLTDVDIMLVDEPFVDNSLIDEHFVDGSLLINAPSKSNLLMDSFVDDVAC